MRLAVFAVEGIDRKPRLGVEPVTVLDIGAYDTVDPMLGSIKRPQVNQGGFVQHVYRGYPLTIDPRPCE